MIAWWWVLLALIAGMALGAAIWSATEQRRRSAELRRRFGPEYDQQVRTHGRRLGETELEHRAQRVEAMQIRELPAGERQQFAERWQAVQARFVDDPKGAIQQADILVAEVMRGRGYPVGDFEQRAADISVDHPNVVQNYRAAHSIAQRGSAGGASTEDLRKAMVHYRALFEDLLGTRVRVAGRSEEGRA